MARIGERRGTYRVLVGRPEGKIDHLEVLGIGGRVILKWTFRTWNGEAWTGLNWLRIETCGGYFETR